MSKHLSLPLTLTTVTNRASNKCFMEIEFRIDFRSSHWFTVMSYLYILYQRITVLIWILISIIYFVCCLYLNASFVYSLEIFLSLFTAAAACSRHTHTRYTSTSKSNRVQKKKPLFRVLADACMRINNTYLICSLSDAGDA